MTGGHHRSCRKDEPTMANPSTERPPKRTFTTLKRRLKAVGFPAPFVHGAILPEWWDKDCEKDPSMLPHAEFEVARFLQLSVEDVRNPSAPLKVPEPSARLRAPKNVDERSLAASIHAARAMAGAAVRNLSSRTPEYKPLPVDPEELRSLFLDSGRYVSFSTLLRTLWGYGIPVLSPKELPSPKFRALACFAEGRPVIVLGKQDKDHPSALVNLAHEAGHVACGHVVEGTCTVDGENWSDKDTDTLEGEAWDYFHGLLPVTPDVLPLAMSVSHARAQVLAAASAQQADPGLLLHYWAQSDPANRSGLKKYVLKELGTFEGAQEAVRYLTHHYLDLEDAPESDLNRLRCCLP